MAMVHGMCNDRHSLSHMTYWQQSQDLSPAAESSVFSSQHQEEMEESVFRKGLFLGIGTEQIKV